MRTKEQSQQRAQRLTELESERRCLERDYQQLLANKQGGEQRQLIRTRINELNTEIVEVIVDE